MKKLYITLILYLISINIFSQTSINDMHLVRWIILSNNIVEGTIVKINDSNFILKVNKNLKGNVKSDSIIVSKELICKKYANYKLNTSGIWILFKNGFQYYLKGRGKSVFYNATNDFFYSPIFGKCSFNNFYDVAKKSSELFEINKISNKIIQKADDNTINEFAKKSSFHKYFINNAKKIVENDKQKK